MRPRVIAYPLQLVAALALTSALLLSGCGGGSDVVATVGDRSITLADYENQLGRLDRENLPRDDSGQVVDTSTMSGKKRFLDVLIDKELMLLKAHELGYDADQDVQEFNKSFLAYRASTIMHEDLIDKPASQVTDEEIQEFYDKLQQKRKFHFLICNFKDDALAARQKLLDGNLWEDVADEYNVGSKGPNGDYTFTIEYGRQEKIFEDVLFSLEPGQISEPILTMYGYWIARLDEILPNKVPPLDAHYRELIRRSVIAHKKKQLKDAFLRESERKHEFKLDETALWIIYQGLPENEAYLDSVTNKPIPKEQLQPLDIPLEDMDRFFMSCRFNLDEEPTTWTIGDYKALYDNLSTFARPKKNQLLGGVRKKIVNDLVDRRLLLEEARERGYYDDPRVTGETRRKTEEMMLTRLHDELVKVDDYVGPAEIDSFWKEHSSEFRKYEMREGHIIYCPDEETAKRALADARDGKDWPTLLRTYGVKMTGAAEDGSFKLLVTDEETPEKTTLFALEKAGDLSEPFASQGKWAVVRLDRIQPGHQPTLDEVRDVVAKRIVAIRKDRLLRKLLDQWREDYGVTVHEDVLRRARSWDELQAAAGDGESAGEAA